MSGNFDEHQAEKIFLKFQPSICYDYLVINILDHCNLKCKGCDHFACISDEYFVSLEKIEKDLCRLGELLQHDYVTSIGLMGGEPLLHPELIPIMIKTREEFPYAEIRLTTNGILLLNQPQIFWDTCRDYDIMIVVTKYPLPNLNHKKMENKANKEKVGFRYFEWTEKTGRLSFKKILRLDGKNSPVKSFANCSAANHANFLMEGKIYGCPFSCQAYRIFNKKFSKNLRITEMDYLDIYKVQDKGELFKFAASPHYFCRYCNGKKGMFPWSQSEQKMEEWTEEEK